MALSMIYYLQPNRKLIPIYLKERTRIDHQHRLSSANPWEEGTQENIDEDGTIPRALRVKILRPKSLDKFAMMMIMMMVMVLTISSHVQLQIQSSIYSRRHDSGGLSPTLHINAGPSGRAV